MSASGRLALGRRWIAAAVVLVLVAVVVIGAEFWQRERESRPVVFAPGELLFADQFERSVAVGWGVNTAGQGYQLDTPEGHSVADGTAQFALTKPRTGHLASPAGVEADDVAVSVDLLAPAAAKAGSGTYFSIQLRSDGSNFYRMQLRFAPRGQLTMTLSKTADGQQTELAPEKTVATGVAPGAPVSVDVEVTGSSPVHLQAGVRQPTAPTQWQLVADDASAGRLVTRGAVSLRAYLGGSTEAPKTVRLDNLQVRRLVQQTVAAGQATTPALAGPVSFGAHATTSGAALPDVGADPVGSADYPLPSSGAIFIDPAGHDDAAGTVDAPLQTLAAAIRRAADDGTIVLRQGSYHESVVIPAQRRLTIQPYPDEAVWLDGSSEVDGWRRTGSVWVVDGWDHFFDSSPTYTKGAPDGTAAGWRFVDPHYPMAAYPDQVWVGARRQLQVASRAEVTDGRFFVDEAHRQLVLGTDPAGSTVRASTLSKALTIAGQGSVVRGIGIRRYATSVWQLGTVTVNAPDVDLRDLTVVDNATTGLSVTAADAQLDKITAQRNGMLGVHAHLADGLRVSRLLAAGNNVENFSRAPVAGGMKVTTSRDIQIQDSAFVGNRGHGLWLDESCYRASVTESTSASNTGSGVVVEVSSDVLVAGDTLSANAGSGLWVINTDQVEIANNTVSMNQQKGITLTTGDRSVQDRKAAVDSRRPDDPAMVWVSRDVTAYNNLIEGAGRCLVCVDDPRTRRVPAVTGVSFDHDVYVPHASAVGAIATWPGPESTVEYPSFAAFRAGTGQETDGRQIDATGTAPTARQPDVVRGLAEVARPLSPAVVEATGRSTDSQQIGAWSEAGNN